ncbi:transglycosylase SLT domain-containing protein [Plantactinospora sp. S1510]|uniref:Transglycosylase SLT domain-containing protein n=1 Tax=Plantactinospora alkalitolerans TaxID=2789879 RepID=A0ABS0H6D7_9ACTN|nr:lytic transglycosylase domain-containing protein [Plantactinospora alkalitolerans]MBF9134030.1 transglycosylase SLT domain-containing protein [Plantactinospora alkalitolerans]
MTRRARRSGRVLVTLLLAVTVAGCANGDPERNGAAPGSDVEQVAGSETLPEAGATTDPPPAVQGLGARPRPSATPSRTPSRKPGPRKAPKPPTESKLPPPPPKAKPGCTKPRYEGTEASRAQVKQALTEAAGRVYWPSSAPSIRVPVDLVKATAWQESGWQSNIIACDGGVGLMQVMPDTADFVNQRFDQSYDIDAYRDNATLGANYLAWLIKYIGDAFFDGAYGVSAADCTTELNSCLLNAVISAYNFGPGAVVTDDGLKIPNPQYVRNVRALMTECECLGF